MSNKAEIRRMDFKTKSGKTIYRNLIREYFYGNYHCATINYKGKKTEVTLGDILED